MKAIETLDKPIYLPARAPHNRVLYEYNRTTDGKEYPVYTLEISSASHPFYTGKQKMLDSAGRVDKFRQKYGK